MPSHDTTPGHARQPTSCQACPHRGECPTIAKLRDIAATIAAYPGTTANWGLRMLDIIDGPHQEQEPTT